jgi:hypothetical protein
MDEDPCQLTTGRTIPSNSFRIMEGRMHKSLRRFAAATALLLLTGAAPQAVQSPPLESRAKTLADTLTQACPTAAYDDVAAFQACAAALRKITLPFDPAIAWGGDQPEKPIRKRGLTHFNSAVYQRLYLPLFTFTGRWAVDEDRATHTPIIRVEAYFRNALPPGTYPYPFWHSATKWSAYETANELRFYLGIDGKAFLITRDAAGSEDRRGPFAHVTPPAFNGWQWHDSNGKTEPHVSLLASLYSPNNPFLPRADTAYKDFALRMRNETCLECHTPANKADAERLVLLQTPMHAAGEIDNVIKAVKSGEMPQNDIGLRADVPPERRAALLQAAMVFKVRLVQADAWESAQKR